MNKREASRCEGPAPYQSRMEIAGIPVVLESYDDEDEANRELNLAERDCREVEKEIERFRTFKEKYPKQIGYTFASYEAEIEAFDFYRLGVLATELHELRNVNLIVESSSK